MVLNPRKIEFRSYKAMASHLNKWAARNLTSPEQWGDVLMASRQWMDYSGRNQVLLASYGAVDGPVAGAETWRLVPSTTEGRSCAVRGGEHGWPVRVPVTTSGSDPDPYLGGVRPTRSAVERFEWRPVFSIEQLARRPAPDALVPVEVPRALTGSKAEEAWLEVTRKVARSTVRGKLPPSSDPQKVLADAAARVGRRSKGPGLEPATCDQVAWLAAERVGQAPGELPGFDPEPFKPSDRWAMLQDTLEVTRKVTATLGVAVGVELTASPLPKMDVVDDRVVPAGAARRLPAASFERLPVGEWVTVGPYTPDEWAARGERGSGAGAYLRLNRSAYLVAVEDGDQAAWRLHDIADRTGHGLLASGVAPTLYEAKDDAYAAVRERYPALTRPPGRDGATPSVGSDGGRQGAANLGAKSQPMVAGASPGWEPVPGEGNSSAQQYRLSERVVVFAFPGPGGRWLPAVQDGGAMTHLPYARTREDAQEAASIAGRRTVRLANVESPALADKVIADLARGDDYSRTELVALAGTQLYTVDRQRLAQEDLTNDDLVDLLRSAGITPATTTLVLHAEGVQATEAARLLPAVGVPMDKAIAVLHEQWGLPRIDAAETLGATATEMRAAGCTPAEVMAARPREVLRVLPADPDVWELAARTMSDGGHPTPRVVSHLVAQAPTPDTFAAGLATAASDPDSGISLAVRYGAQGEHLAAASERYGLSPAETAIALHASGTPPQIAIDTLHVRCEGDPAELADLAEGHLGISTHDLYRYLADTPSIPQPSPNAGEHRPAGRRPVRAPVVHDAAKALDTPAPTAQAPAGNGLALPTSGSAAGTSRPSKGHPTLTADMTGGTDVSSHVQPALTNQDSQTLGTTSDAAATAVDPTDPAALLAMLPEPGPATASDPADLLAMLPDPEPHHVAQPDLGDTP